jgi:hypothetical protein
MVSPEPGTQNQVWCPRNLSPEPSPLGFPVLRSISLYRHAVVNTPMTCWALIAHGTAYSNRFPVPSGCVLPILVQGRRPHWSSRGLLNTHWRLRPVGSLHRLKRHIASEAPKVSFPPPSLRELAAGATQLPRGNCTQ